MRTLELHIWEDRLTPAHSRESLRTKRAFAPKPRIAYNADVVRGVDITAACGLDVDSVQRLDIAAVRDSMPKCGDSSTSSLSSESMSPLCGDTTERRR